MKESKRILVIKHGALGDFFNALGAFLAIRQYHSNDYITLLTSHKYMSFGKRCGYFDNVLEDNRTFFSAISFRKLVLNNFDRIYDLQNSQRTNFYHFILGPGKRPEWNGIALGCSHRQTIANRRKIHAYPRFEDQLKIAGIKKMFLPNLDWIREDLSKFSLPKKFMLIIPGSSITGKYKRWPSSCYVELSKIVLKKKITPIIIGSKEDKDITDFIYSKVPESYNLSEKTTIYELVELARRSLIIVGNDTGPTHISAMTGTKTIILWSNQASDPNVFAPKIDNVEVISSDCLRDLSVDKVEKSVFKMLMYS